MNENGQNMTAEQKKLRALYERYERDFYARQGKSPAEIARKFAENRQNGVTNYLPRAEELKLKRNWRSYIPGIFEYYTDNPDCIFLFPYKYRMTLNVLFLLVPVACLLVIDRPAKIYLAVLAVGAILATVLQQAVLFYLYHTHKLEVHRYGTTPYTKLGRRI